MTLVWTLAESIQARGRPSEETRLVADSLRGDRDAFSVLIRRHQRHVFRLAGRFFRQRADVEDAAQETFLAAWRKLDTYRRRAPFEHWLTRICLNCCYDRMRRESHEQSLLIDAAARQPDPDAGMELRRLLATLAPADRFVLLLLYGEGWSVEEIADRLGWTRVNVRVRAHRARRKLQHLLETGDRP